MSPKEYIRFLQRRRFLSPTSLVFSVIDPNSPKGREQIARARRVVGLSALDPQPLKDILGVFPWTLLDPIAEKLHKKSLEMVGSSHSEQLSKVAVGFLPTGILNAACFGGLEGGYAIAINNGLFFSLTLLGAALWAPDLKDELIYDVQETVNPQETLEAVVKAAKEPTPANYQEVERYFSYLTPEIIAVGTVVTSLALQFIHLHEIGHICNGDVDNGVARAIFDPDREELAYLNASFKQEFAADEFALRAFLSLASDAPGAWSAFASVEAFFLFLRETERTRRPSRTHPPAMQRLRYLRDITEKLWGVDNFGYGKRMGIRFREMRNPSKVPGQVSARR